MIDVEEAVSDPDMIQPQPFVIRRYNGVFIPGGFQNILAATFQQTGPVRNATDKEMSMLPEADRTSQGRNFFTTMQVLAARSTTPVLTVHGEAPQGAGTTFVLSTDPSDSGGQLIVNGLLQKLGVDYTLAGKTITLTTPVETTASLWFRRPVTLPIGTGESDVIAYDDDLYRVMAVYRVSGSGYWRALGTKMDTS